MRQLIDSSEYLAEGEVLRGRMRDDGVLFFRGLLDPNAVRSVRTKILDAVRPHGWVDANDKPTGAPRFEGDANWWGGYRAIQCIEEFHALAHQASALTMLETLFQGAALVHPRKIARIVWPNQPTFTTAPHQDFPLIAGTVDFFTMWVPLGAVSTADGGLRVLLGSQTNGVRKTRAATGAGGIGIDISPDDPAWATVDYMPGDVLLFHSLTVHAGMPNVSDNFRISADYRYQPVEEPVGQWSLFPHIWEKSEPESWSEFTGTWSDQRWVQVPTGIHVAPAPRAVLDTTEAFRLHAGAAKGNSRFVDSHVFSDSIAE